MLLHIFSSYTFISKTGENINKEFVVGWELHKRKQIKFHLIHLLDMVVYYYNTIKRTHVKNSPRDKRCTSKGVGKGRRRREAADGRGRPPMPGRWVRRRPPGPAARPPHLCCSSSPHPRNKNKNKNKKLKDVVQPRHVRETKFCGYL